MLGSFILTGTEFSISWGYRSIVPYTHLTPEEEMVGPADYIHGSNNRRVNPGPGDEMPQPPGPHLMIPGMQQSSWNNNFPKKKIHKTRAQLK